MRWVAPTEKDTANQTLEKRLWAAADQFRAPEERSMNTETHSQLANFIWSICNLLRGPYKRNEYRKVLLPLTVLRRFDCLRFSAPFVPAACGCRE